jgi:putative tricarboxylic transport membrane protein
MNDTEPEARDGDHGVVSERAIEIVVAFLIMALSVLVMVSNHRLGAQWAAEGPEAGYFPFYVGVSMFVASTIVFGKAVIGRARPRAFVTARQCRLVIALLVPTALYIAGTAWLGLYATSAAYLAYFMRVHGGYGAKLILPVAIGIPLVLFVVFEIWFLIPLPKGPLEAWLGY